MMHCIDGIRTSSNSKELKLHFLYLYVDFAKYQHKIKIQIKLKAVSKFTFVLTSNKDLRMEKFLMGVYSIFIFDISRLLETISGNDLWKLIKRQV